MAQYRPAGRQIQVKRPDHETSQTCQRQAGQI